MKHFRLRLSVFFSLISLVVGIFPSVAATPDWYSKFWPTVPSIGTTINDDVSPNMRTESTIWAMSYAPGVTSGIYQKNETCTALSDATCLSADSIALNLLLSPCEKTSSPECIDSLKIGESSGTFITGILDTERKTSSIPADPKFGTPAGGGISIWRVPGKVNSLGTELYAVQVYISLQNFKNKDCNDPTLCPFKLGNFSAQVYPVKIEPSSVNAACLWFSNDECATIGAFPDNSSVALAIRMTSRLTGFLYGRIQNIEVALTPITKELNLLNVVGQPVDVPGIYGFVPKSELEKNPEIENYWRRVRSNLADSELKSNQTINLGRLPIYAMEDFLALEKYMRSSHTVKSIWKFGNGLNPWNANSCYSDTSKFLGIVTSNASVLSPNPPIFDGTSIDFKVAGAHFLADGTSLTKGTYDLAMTSEFARCLYKFSNAPIQASISITSEDGATQNVATQIIRQDKEKKWLFLSARNFTFSSPTIKVSLSQETTVASNSKSPKATSKKTIVCVKGKNVKKITGTNPKCPSGYKKS